MTNPLDDYRKLTDALKPTPTTTSVPSYKPTPPPARTANTNKAQTTVTRNAASLARAKKAKQSNYLARAQMSAAREPRTRGFTATNVQVGSDARSKTRKSGVTSYRPARKKAATRKSTTTRKGTTKRNTGGRTRATKRRDGTRTRGR